MLTITKYEQSAFTVACGESLLAVDFGSYSSPATLDQVGEPTAAVVSHIHPDHFSQEVLERFSCPVTTVAEVAEAIEGEGGSLPVQVISEGQELEIPGTPFRVLATASDHGPRVSAPVENVGFVIEADGRRIYFLGDMAVSTPPPTGEFDLMLVPVGNRGYVFDPQAAFEHVKGMGYRGRLVPVHYSGGSDPEAGEQFADLVGGMAETRVLRVGESLSF